jgi:anaerobic dimethyl sulfoxide reductase subunit B (iron-sulfur subunit)
MSGSIFTIHLTRCTGCYACQIACKDRASLPDELDWLRVEEHEAGAYPTPTLMYRVVHCFHCAEPPCAEACPTDAIAKGDDGFVGVDADLCIGCEACIDACPFGTMTMLPEGVASKCDGCVSEVAQGWAPTCVRACPMRALRFGLPHETAAESGRPPDETFDDHGVRPGVVYLA